MAMCVALVGLAKFSWLLAGGATVCAVAIDLGLRGRPRLAAATIAATGGLWLAGWAALGGISGGMTGAEATEGTEAVTEGGEIILAKIRPAEAGPEPLPFREMAREPLPLFERFDVDGAFAREVEADIAERDAFARLRGETPEMPIPWASAVAERWINLAIALWATSTRKGLRELIPSLTASTHNSVSDVLVEGGFRNFASGDPGDCFIDNELRTTAVNRSERPRIEA
jgi:hypothetical protein